jgi:hypothetical protein
VTRVVQALYHVLSQRPQPVCIERHEKTLMHIRYPLNRRDVTDR